MTLTVTLFPLVLVVVALALALGTAVRQRHARARTDVAWITGHHPTDPDVAATDEIMGIPNRRRFLELLQRELIRASRYRRPLSLLAVRVDRFAAVADGHGPAVADAVLRAVAATVVADLRASDSFGRLVDDTFGVCLPETDAAGAVAVAERVVAEVRAVEVPAAGAVVAVTASVAACSVAPGDVYDLDRLLADAEAALDRCRLAGGDQVRSDWTSAVGFGPPAIGRGA